MAEADARVSDPPMAQRDDNINSTTLSSVANIVWWGGVTRIPPGTPRESLRSARFGEERLPPKVITSDSRLFKKRRGNTSSSVRLACGCRVGHRFAAQRPEGAERFTFVRVFPVGHQARETDATPIPRGDEMGLLRPLDFAGRGIDARRPPATRTKPSRYQAARPAPGVAPHRLPEASSTRGVESSRRHLKNTGSRHPPTAARAFASRVYARLRSYYKSIARPASDWKQCITKIDRRISIFAVSCRHLKWTPVSASGSQTNSTSRAAGAVVL